MSLINKRIGIIENIFVVILVYLLSTRYKNKYDELLIFTLGGIVLLRYYIDKEKLRINQSGKKIFFLLIIWTFCLSLSFINILNQYNKFGYYVILYRNLLIGGILLFIISLYLRLGNYINKKRIIILINLFSIYSVFKGLLFISENGVLRRGSIWGNPNYYSMIVGLFIIISYISLLYEKNKVLKTLYFILNMLQIFCLVSIGQSRNVFFSLIAVYILGMLLFLIIEKKVKLFSKKTLGLLTIIFIILISINYLEINLRVFNVGVEEVVDDPRMLIWKKALIEENFNILHGKGFAYYTMNNFKDKVGVSIAALHNDYLEIFVTQGIFSLISYLLFFIFSFFIVLKKLFRERDICSFITLMIILYFGGIGMFDNPLYQKRVFQFLFLFLGLTLSSEIFYSDKLKCDRE